MLLVAGDDRNFKCGLCKWSNWGTGMTVAPGFKVKMEQLRNSNDSATEIHV